MSITVLRTLMGDPNSEYFTDDELTAYLLVGNDSLLRAQGHAYAALSRDAAAESANIATDDLKVSTEKRAADYLALSKLKFEQANQADGGEAYFEIIPFNPATRVLP